MTTLRCPPSAYDDFYVESTLSRHLRILEKRATLRDCVLINRCTYQIARSRFSGAARRQLFDTTVVIVCLTA